MFTRLVICLLVIQAIDIADTACRRRVVGGFQSSSNSDLQAEVVKLAQAQLPSTSGNTTPSIKVISFKTQVVAGTNIEMVFTVDDQETCTLKAFKPLPYTQKPMTVTSVACTDIPLVRS